MKIQNLEIYIIKYFYYNHLQKSKEYNNKIFLSLQKINNKNNEKYIDFIENKLKDIEYYNSELELLNDNKLKLLENDICNMYNENKRLQKQINELYKELEMRDHLENNIEISIQSILDRLSYLEYKNIK